MHAESQRKLLRAVSVSLALQVAELVAVAGVLLPSLAPFIPHSSPKTGGGSSETSRAGRSPQYVAPQNCQLCHSDIYTKYQQGAMARSFYRPTSKNVVEDYTTNNHLFHASSNRHYQMIQRNGNFYQRRYQLDSSGKEENVFEQEITFVIGSGNHARTYVNLSAGGVLTQLPVSWYSQEQRWAMSPGYDHSHHDDFARKITHACMLCHNAYPQLPEKSDRYGQESVFSQVLPSGIDCQRCHGPGSLHVDLASRGGIEVEEVRQAIVNPARLGSERQLDVCMQCHLETTSGSHGNHVQRFGRSVYSFRPGEPLGDYIVHFDLVDPTSGKPNDRFEIDGSAYRLRQSACFQKSNGGLTCTTCHDAHQTPSAPEVIRHFRKICLSCHDQLSTAEHAVPEDIDCVKCHMPKRRTEDVVHVAMTDHFIQRNLLQRNPMEPLKEDHSVKREQVVLYLPQVLPPSERDLYWGIAQIQSKSNLNEGMTRLKAALERDNPSVPEPYVELALAQIERGRLDEAKANLGRALKIDPTLVIAHHNLGEILRKQSRLEEAEGRYRQVFRIEPDHTETHNSLGIILAKQQPDLAIEHFRKALRRNPQLVEAYTNLGITCLRLGKLEEAIDAFKMAIRVKPQDSEAHNMLGLASIKLGRLQDAINAFELAVRINPDNAGAHYNLGTTYLILGEKPSALKQHEVLRNQDKERADRLLDQINPKNGGREK